MLEITPSTARPELPIGQIRDTRSDSNRPSQNVPADRMPDQDRVELSATAQEQQVATETAMAERLAELRTRIADGTYLTPEKIDYVIERLREELFGQSDAA